MPDPNNNRTRLVRGEMESHQRSYPAMTETLLSLSINLDRNSPVPLYRQLAQQVQGSIENGEIPRGSRLGNEVLLAGRLGVSRPTMRRAIQDLVDQGMVVRKRGVGTQVLQGSFTRPVKLTSLFDDLTDSDQAPMTKVLSHQYLPASAQVAAKLQVPSGELVLRLRRLRTAQHEPLAILENFLPVNLADVDEDVLESGGLYQALRDTGVKIVTANQRIGARQGTPDECELLNEPPESPVLTADRLAFNDSGQAIEWGQHVYRPSLYSFTVTLVR